MDRVEEQLPLIHGCNVISKKQRRMQIVTGYLYQFDSNYPHQPRPLPIVIAILNCLSPILLVAVDLLLQLLRKGVNQESTELRALGDSVFVERLSKIFMVYRICSMIASVFILLAQHGSMANTIAACNNYVTEREQINLANRTSMFFIMKSLASTIAYLSILSLYKFNSDSPIWSGFLALVVLYLVFITRMMHNAPLVYICYLGSALGKHVENFSTIYVDTMFDQFMKAIEKEDQEELAEREISMSLPYFDTSSLSSRSERNESNQIACCSGCYRYICAIKHRVVWAFAAACHFIRIIAARLNMRKYPELPEMKMTKLSSTTNIQISESVRTANSHLIRVRLRKTQIMLSELRDLVSDINKTSSPIIMMYMVYETVLIILITTASIQAKVYKSFSLLLLPTIAITLGFVANVIYLCTCLDETTKQLKLLINKLFDFIIMNHRIQSSGKRELRSKAQIHSMDSEYCPLSGSEDGAINETWSQFQYTRKLANTIRFTMGGLLPVTRRLVLSILGHVLSAAFISIEIMSIIDTLNRPHSTNDNHHVKSISNTRSKQHYEMILSSSSIH